MRAKMRVAIVDLTGARENIVAFPVSAPSYPNDGSDENNTYAKWTPLGRLELTIENPSLVGKIAVGDTFYVDFIPCEKG